MVVWTSIAPLWPTPTTRVSICRGVIVVTAVAQLSVVASVGVGRLSPGSRGEGDVVDRIDFDVAAVARGIARTGLVTAVAELGVVEIAVAAEELDPSVGIDRQIAGVSKPVGKPTAVAELSERIDGKFHRWCLRL